MQAQDQLPLFSLFGQRVLVVGLGESGLAMARWAQLQQAASVLVIDSRQTPGSLADLPAGAGSTRFQPMGFDEAQKIAWNDQVDLVAWSPGLSIEKGPSAAFYQHLLAQGLPVLGEIELFAQGLVALRERGYRPKVVAITGTNGKTTTTQLVRHLCESAGLRTVAAGNISPAALQALAVAQQDQLWPDVWVLELSSFQLALTQSLQADACVVLNISQDHLDWHNDMAHYAAAKRRIFPVQGSIVINRADPQTWPEDLVDWPPIVQPSKALRRKSKDAALPPAPRKLCSFGLDAPQVAGDFGRVKAGGINWLACAQADDDGVLSYQRLMPADAMRLRGAHNQGNALAALALAKAIGVPMAKMLFGLRSFAGDKHRCELVARINEVEYYDDSKGTNAGATIAAIQGIEKPVVLIVGGDGKGQDFSALASAIVEQATHSQAPLRAAIHIGRDGPTIAALIADQAQQFDVRLAVIKADSLEQAVELASQQAQGGDAVLMSPACASFDMFRNYAHRAEVFVQAVGQLALMQGQTLEVGL
jgi:UDP-N-acetylmuramoylalanine--D-glutamate ligase